MDAENVVVRDFTSTFRLDYLGRELWQTSDSSQSNFVVILACLRVATRFNIAAMYS